MRRILLLISIFVALPVALSAQWTHWVYLPGDDGVYKANCGYIDRATNFERHRLEGDVKSVVAKCNGEEVSYEFNREGDATHIVFRNVDGNVVASLTSEYTYDDDGRRILSYDMDESGLFIQCFDERGEVIAFDFSEDGCRESLLAESNRRGMLSAIYLCDNGYLTDDRYYFSYLYDADGNVMSRSITGCADCVTLYDYDDESRLRMVTHMDKGQNWIVTQVLRYDEYGNLVRKEYLHDTNMVYSLDIKYSAPDRVERVVRTKGYDVDYVEEYTYSEDGTYLLVMRYNGNNEFVRRVEMELDSMGNVTKMVTTPGGYSAIDVVTFDIEYYE